MLKPTFEFTWDSPGLCYRATWIWNALASMFCQKQKSVSASWQEALQKSRPDFISRSQGRIRKLEQRAQERREQAASRGPKPDAAPRQRRAHSSRPISHNGTVPAAILTSLMSLSAHSPIAAAAGFCHMADKTHTDTEQRARGGFSQYVLFYHGSYIIQYSHICILIGCLTH